MGGAAFSYGDGDCSIRIVAARIDPQEKLRRRVVDAAGVALEHKSYVTAIDVFCGMGLLAPSHLNDWRQGRVDYLERVMQGNLSKISEVMKLFREWARQANLKPSETLYVRRTRSGTLDLRFSRSGDPDIERAYRTHYVSPHLSERKQEKLQQKLNEEPKMVVFQVLRDTACSECGTEIEQNSLLIIEAEQALCMACAGMDHLEFLPAGDATLTRRATKFSSMTATVVRFSRSRNRYERQGILVEPAAMEQAEASCYEDADQRAASRLRDVERRKEEDKRLMANMAERIRVLFPRCPPAEAAAIAEHTARRGSGRVGRSAAGRRLQDDALVLAVRAAVRHRHTDYDELLMSGVERQEARDRVLGTVEDVLEKWR